MHVALAPYRGEHYAAFARWCGDADAFAFLRKSNSHASNAETLFGSFLTASASARRGERVWAIVEQTTSDLVGHLELKKTQKTISGEGELVVFAGPRSRRMGVATDAVGTLVGSPRLAPEFTRILAVCSPTNVASLRLVARAGFKPLPDRSTARALFFGRAFDAR
jgi:RimJ/RimL family protein N-acetyltransferase